MKTLLKGLPGHPTHPPLTDATIGAYTVATVLGVLGAFGVAEDRMAAGWWLALIVGLVFNAPTSTTGLLDWLEISRGTELWKTATTHLVTMVSATLFFGLAALVGYSGFSDGDIQAWPLVLTLIGFGLLTVGGWIGGTIVYVHGMRVLEEPEKPADAAIVPPEPERRPPGDS